MPKETLTCQGLPDEGPHSFTRERTRGRKPQFCPRHLYLKFEASKPPSAPQREKTEPLVLARAAKQQKAVESRSKTSELVERILSDPRVNGELKNKLRYAHRRAKDEALMASVRTDLIRQATRKVAV